MVVILPRLQATLTQAFVVSIVLTAYTEKNMQKHTVQRKGLWAATMFFKLSLTAVIYVFYLTASSFLQLFSPLPCCGLPFNRGLKTIAFYIVGFSSLFPVPNQESQDFKLRFIP
jgi:hypothetical protein